MCRNGHSYINNGILHAYGNQHIICYKPLLLLTLNRLIRAIALDYPITGFRKGLTSNLQPSLTGGILIEGNGIFSATGTALHTLKRVADRVSFH